MLHCTNDVPVAHSIELLFHTLGLRVHCATGRAGGLICMRGNSVGVRLISGFGGVSMPRLCSTNSSTDTCCIKLLDLRVHCTAGCVGGQ